MGRGGIALAFKGDNHAFQHIGLHRGTGSGGISKQGFEQGGVVLGFGEAAGDVAPDQRHFCDFGQSGQSGRIVITQGLDAIPKHLGQIVICRVFRMAQQRGGEGCAGRNWHALQGGGQGEADGGSGFLSGQVNQCRRGG